MLKIKSIFTSIAIAVATLVGLAPSANAVATATAPIAASAYSGTTTFSVNNVPSITAYSFKIKITKTSDVNIYREIYTTFTGNGNFNVALDILALESLLASHNSVAAIYTYNGLDGWLARLPNGSYDVEYLYRDYFNSSIVTTINVANVYFSGATELCPAGKFSSTGLTSATCVDSPTGSYVPGEGYSEAIPCEAGSFQDLVAQSSCKPAEPGHYVDLANQISQTACPGGFFQPDARALECLPARIGHYVAGTGHATDVACEPGTFRLESGQTSCLDAPAGTYVSETGAHATFDCVPGTFSANARSTSCLQAPANFYVDTRAAIVALACPSGLTSPQGSDAVSDCIVPVVAAKPAVAKYSPSLAKGKTMKIVTLAKSIKMSIPSKAKTTATVAKASKKYCVVTGTGIKALKRGACVVTLKVKPVKGKTTTKTTKITIK